MVFLFKILCKGVHYKSWFSCIGGSWKWASNTLSLGEKITLEIHLKKLWSRFWKAIIWLGLCMLGPLTSYFFGDQLFRFDMWREDWKTSNHFCSFSTLMIKHYNLSIHKWYCCVFFSYVISNMSSLNLYGYNSK